MVTSMRAQGPSAGFTLIEMMLVVGIVGVLAVYALPSMRDLVTTNRMKSVSLDLYTSLALARSEAIKRNNGAVSVIPATGGWQNGWTVTCVDTASSCGGAGNLVLIASEAVDASLTLTGPAGNVTFSRDGRLAVAAAAFQIKAGTNNARSPMRCVDVNTSGRPKTSVDSNAVDSDGCN
jgi:type IV fimbrial biogenesis protein FimT